MPIVTCQNCERKEIIRDDQLGQQVICPRCRKVSVMRPTAQTKPQVQQQAAEQLAIVACNSCKQQLRVSVANDRQHVKCPICGASTFVVLNAKPDPRQPKQTFFSISPSSVLEMLAAVGITAVLIVAYFVLRTPTYTVDEICKSYTDAMKGSRVRVVGKVRELSRIEGEPAWARVKMYDGDFRSLYRVESKELIWMEFSDIAREDQVTMEGVVQGRYDIKPFNIGAVRFTENNIIVVLDDCRVRR